MFKSNDYYNFEDFKVGSAVVCYYQHKKHIGIVTCCMEEDYLSIFWEGDRYVSNHGKYEFDSGRKSFALLKDWKKYKEQMKDIW